jgi:hypothetical protein
MGNGDELRMRMRTGDEEGGGRGCGSAAVLSPFSPFGHNLRIERLATVKLKVQVKKV